LWIKSKDFNECVENSTYTTEVNDQTNEWRSLFNVTGTPGNVIIDKETGKFVLIPWAYPAEKFIEEIEKMKAE
jgi:thioredoxin-related protein